MVECLTRNRGAAGSSLTGVTALCPLAIYINPSFVLVQPRKTRLYITEGLLMGRKESIQTNTVFGDLNQYKMVPSLGAANIIVVPSLGAANIIVVPSLGAANIIMVPSLGAANAAPNEVTTLLY